MTRTSYVPWEATSPAVLGARKRYQPRSPQGRYLPRVLNTFRIAALAIGLTAAGSACGSSTHVRAYVPVLKPKASFLAFQPQRLIVAGDGSELLTRIRYQNYGDPQTEASGTLLVDDCVNSCAGGTFHPVRASLRFGGRVTCHGKPVYTKLKIDAPGAPRFNSFRHQSIGLDYMAALCEPGTRKRGPDARTWLATVRRPERAPSVAARARRDRYCSQGGLGVRILRPADLGQTGLVPRRPPPDRSSPEGRQHQGVPNRSDLQARRSSCGTHADAGDPALPSSSSNGSDTGQRTSFARGTCLPVLRRHFLLLAPPPHRRESAICSVRTPGRSSAIARARSDLRPRIHSPFGPTISTHSTGETCRSRVRSAERRDQSNSTTATPSSTRSSSPGGR